MEQLTQLHLAGSNIAQLHPSIERLTGLTLLKLSYCVRLSSLPCEIGNLRSLKTLLLKYCIKLDQIPPSLANAESLETLSIVATSISHVPSSMHCLKNLKLLECDGLSRGIWKSLLPQFNSHPISSGLGCLITLNLSRCKLEDEDVPEDLHCFSSLEILDLSYNDFVKLPDSLSHLKKLKTLNLNYCTKLKDLPKLPASLQIVQGVDCRSISEQFYNKILLIPSGFEYHLHLDFSIPSKTAEVEYTINDFQHSMLNRRLYEVNISDERLYFFSRSQVDILECFDQINIGDWINIDYNQQSSFDNDISNVCGVFLSANIEYQQTLHHFKDIVGNVSIDFEIDGNPSNSRRIMMKGEFPSTRCVWVTYLPVKLFKDDLMCQNGCSIKATISCDNKYVKVKAWGASILSWQNASEYLAKLFTKAYSSTHKFQRIIVEPNHKSECKCDELEVAKKGFLSSTFESSGTDSTFLLRKNLRSILGRMFEADKRYCVRYFFPQTKISGWFGNQNKKDKVAVKLPLNIYKDKKWMGLAMFAIFSVSENAEYRAFDYEIQSDMWILFNRKYFIPINLLERSSRILFIVFEPRNWYPYHLNSSSNHLYISFNTNAERMKVELCGARLVSKQNFEGFIQTIVDCIVESGDDLYEHYNQENIKYLLSMVHSQKHHESSLQDGFAYEPTTSLSCIDSSFSIEQLLHGSFPHPLLQTSVEERFGGKFDIILHGDMIPELFTNQSIGNTGRMKLHRDMIPYLDLNPNMVGLGVCALVVVDQQMRKLNDIQERERYTKVVDLICKFRVDSYEMRPEHYHFVPQEKLLSQYASQFIWFFYTPVTEFGITWYNCNYIGMTIETSCDELFRVQQCGLRLIHKMTFLLIKL